MVTKVSAAVIDGITASGTTEPRTLSDRFADVVNVKDFGAVGDGETDDTAAIQATIDYIESAGGGVVYLPAGTYLISSTLTCEAAGIVLEGAGRDVTIIDADHTTGAAIRIKLSYSGVRDLTVDATATRQAGAAGSNYGIWFETDDIPESAPSNRLWACSVRDVTVRNQPSHGLIMVSTPYMSTLERVRCDSNGGHGFAVDLGSLTGRSEQSLPPGVITAVNCFAYNNGGHAFAAGHPDDAVLTPTLRIQLINFDCARNATVSGVRYQVDQVYLRGTDHRVIGSAFDDGDNSASGSIAVAGRNIHLIGNRYLSGPRSVRILGYAGFETDGIYIDGLDIIGPVQSHAIIADTSNVSNVRVVSRKSGGYTQLISAGVPGLDVDRSTLLVRKLADQTVTNSVAVVDDDQLVVTVAANERFRFDAFLRVSGPAATGIRIAFAIPSGSMAWSGVNGCRVSGGSVIPMDQQTLETDIALWDTSGAGAVRIIQISGFVSVGGTGGDFNLKWAQSVADPGDTTVLADSYIKVERWRQ